jgi:hypothetical protein
MPIERRAWPRISLFDRDDTTAGARLLPGWSARVIDLSCGGALVETDCRLMPGAPIELQLIGFRPARRVRGHVTRSQVAAIDRDLGVRYRGALVFDEQVEFLTGSAECE